MNSGELKVDVPLASIESDCEDHQDETGCQVSDNKLAAGSDGGKKLPNVENFGGDSVTGSLEDLVNSFDEKLTMCFHDYQEQVDKIAPVQVRSQEEIMNECQVWWTITGNFGNMMPIDWSKSTARARQLPTLKLAESKKAKARLSSSSEDIVDGLEDEDDMVAADLDMHSLILSSNPQENADPVKSADEVIREIDDIIESTEADEAGSLEDSNPCPRHSLLPRLRLVNEALKGRKLDELSSNELSQILADVEVLVKELSEELVHDLGVRDELEYEKELKNTFISLLLSIQSRKRSCSAGHPAGEQRAGGRPSANKYLTTVIPYQADKGSPPSLQCLQVLVKILKAINEDSPAVPALLTDYILKVLCPS